MSECTYKILQYKYLCRLTSTAYTFVDIPSRFTSVMHYYRSCYHKHRRQWVYCENLNYYFNVYKIDYHIIILRTYVDFIGVAYSAATIVNYCWIHLLNCIFWFS